MISFVGCAPTAEVSQGYGGPDMQAAQAAAYNGPQARIAISRFTDKTGKGWWTGDIGDGMADMLATALFNSNRFIVLERSTLSDVLSEQDLGASGRVSQETAAPIGQIEGAELLVTGAVTGYEPDAGGLGGAIGGLFGSPYGEIASSIKNSYLAIDIRVIDTRTSRILAAGTVEGRATDFGAGFAVIGGSLGGGLSGWSKTPMEKALRVCLAKAVEFITNRTPTSYYHYQQQQPQAAAPVPLGPPK
jgi:curli biogenesis system outer membrane secretion channel CsgG